MWNVATLVLALILAPQSTQESGLVERTRSELVLIDVDARDKEGNPRRNLTVDDFTVVFNGKTLEIETFDQLPDCGQPVQRANTWQGLPTPERHFVLYFDLAQMDADGRDIATREAKKWLNSAAAESTRVTIAAYTANHGVETLADRVTPDQALPAVARVRKGKRFNDTTVIERDQAWFDCGDDFERCVREARADHSVTGRSLRALLFYLTQLDAQREGKSLILLHQNLVASTAERLIGLNSGAQPRDFLQEQQLRDRIRLRVGDHATLLQELAGTAFIGRTKIYPITIPSLNSPLAITLGKDLARRTGGRTNTQPGTVQETMRFAQSDCPSAYRLGIRPSKIGIDNRSRIRIELQGEPLLALNSIRIPDRHDRWVRNAEAVLSNPERATDLPIHAALAPQLNDDGSWGLEAVVNFDARILEMLPDADKQKGQWEVGALLIDLDRGKSWEMLGKSAVRVTRKPEDPAQIVHVQHFDKMRPGLYELRAFVRDRWTNTYGGARAELDLQKAKPGSFIGPVVLHTQPHLETSLPMRTKKVQRNHHNKAARSEQTRALYFDRPPIDQPLQLVSWGCGNEASPMKVVEASLVGDQFRRDLPVEVVDADGCARASSDFDLSGLESGDYEYVVYWRAGDGDEFVLRHPLRIAGR